MSQARITASVAGPAAPTRSQPSCPICDSPLTPAFEGTLLGRLRVTYSSCAICGLLQTEPPYWLEEAYQHVISPDDTGLVARNVSNTRFLKTFLPLAFPKNARFVDVAGGYGLLTRMLRDEGFDCYSTDPFCTNIFAANFEPGESFHADAVFAFEALEHMHDPLCFVQECFNKFDCRTLVFSTLTFSETPPGNDWWYYSFDTGQHVTFYQSRSLAALAKRLGCHYQMVHPGLHVISARSFPLAARLFLSNRIFRKSLLLCHQLLPSRQGKTWEDHLLEKRLHRRPTES